MKTAKFWQIMTAAVVIAAMVCATSCKKDIEIVPEVIESEVLESGCDATVVETAGTEGTLLSYESWIKVRQVTKAVTDNKLSVTLFNRFNNVIDEVEVADFNFGKPTVDVSFRKVDSRVEQRYINVIDSVMVYRLTYENDFTIEYELQYEAPYYYDGVNKHDMPYLRIGAIVDNGFDISAMESQTVDGKTYFRRLVRHSISVVFNDKSYEVTSSIVARSLQAPQDLLLASRKVDEGLEFVSSDAENLSGVYRSWVKIEQEWSESGVKTITKEVMLKHTIGYPVMAYPIEVAKRYETFTDLRVEQSLDEPTITLGEVQDNVAVDVYKNQYRIEIYKESDPEFFDTFLLVQIDERARYVDEFTKCDFPCAKYTEASFSWQFVEGWHKVTQYDLTFERADFKLTFNSVYGKASYPYEHPWYWGYGMGRQ